MVLKRKTGDIVDDADMVVIFREMYSEEVPDNDMNRKLYEKYPRLKESDEQHFKDHQVYGYRGSISGCTMDDGRIIISCFFGETQETINKDDLVESMNMIEQYLSYKGAPEDLAFPDGMGGELWNITEQAIGEIAGYHPVYDFYIVKSADADENK